MKIYITRHGQVLPQEFVGSVDFPKHDIPLSDKGKEQATLLGKELKRRNFKGRIISSPYTRTMTTAENAAAECGAAVYTDGALREMLFRESDGLEFRGKTLEELQAEFPHVAADAKLPYPWWTTFVDDGPGLSARADGFWTKLMEEVKEDDEIVIVGHGASVVGSFYYFNHTYQLGFPEEYMELGAAIGPNNLNCNISCFELDKDKKLIRAALFDTAHLPDEYLTSNSRPAERPEIMYK